MLTVQQALDLALQHHQAGRLADAEALYRQILAVQPGNFDVLQLLGAVALTAGRYEEAVELISRALALSPDNSAFEANLGEACRRLGRVDEAIIHLRRAVALQPDLAEAWSNLGNALAEKDQWEEAAACYERGVTLRPGDSAMLSNLALALQAVGQWDRALASCERALAIDPEFAQAHSARALMLLRLGRYGEGWPELEWRWRCLPLSASRRPFTTPQWSGQPVAGQAILAHAEQGFGDAIQFLRYIPRLLEKAVGSRVVLECDAPLVRLFASAFPNGEFHARGTRDGSDLPHCDCHIPWLSLPFALDLAEPMEMKRPYLQADATLRDLWRARLDGAAPLRVGVAWEGSAAHPLDHLRSLAAETLLPLLHLPGVSLFSLQIHSAREAPAALLTAGLIDFTDQITDFADTAALMAELDLIISVDTAVAHLAGALGRPVWTLLPFVPDWRWGLEREDSPWYPTMRLFRQPALGDWDSVIQRVAGELRCAVAEKRLQAR